MSHSHSQGHDDHDHGHDHSHSGHDHSDDLTPALQSLLYDQIDFGKVETLNETGPGSGRAILQKTWQQRLDPEPDLESDADEQLLMKVPFTGQVRLHSILLRTSSTSSAPKTLSLFLNRDDLDFSLASDLSPTQSFELSQTSEIQEIGVKRALFNTTQSLTLFFVDNFGDGEEDVTRISYVGFKGEYMRLNKEPVNFLYEAAANPGDHKAIVGTKQGMSSGLGGAPGGRDGM
ncbi:MAG: hypothetical protein M1820_010620 [Bogoriella megaspora]|nr:MAG: hypothetical protein M1820_010620 [Bogoriella megaspora]